MYEPLNRDGASSEAELLLAVARPHLDADTVRRANAALARGIDWDTFIPLAYDHGVVPLLYRHLSSGSLDAAHVADDAVAASRRLAEKIARRSLFLTGELVTLLREFERQEIRVVPLKGPILAEQLYGSVALRRFNDLDLLVALEDLERATALIISRGYVLGDARASDAQPAMRRDRSQHRQLFAAANTHCVELHYYLLSPVGGRRVTMAMIESGLELGAIHGVPVGRLRGEELLVYLCVHGNSHAWARLEWLGSVAELLRSGRVVDWDRVSALALRFSAQRALRASLYLARDLFDAPIPSAVLRGDRAAQTVARSVAMRFLSDPGRQASPVESLVYQARTDDGFARRSARLWLILLVPTAADMAVVPLPRALHPLYYLVRPLRLAARRLRRLGRAASRSKK
jgi:hypothetical protein